MKEDFIMIDVSDLPTGRNISAVDFAHQATNLAYKLKNPANFATAEQLAGAKLLGTGWEILYDSSKSISTNQSGYKAVAFIKEATKEVHIATAGTIPTDIRDLIDDGLVAIKRVPYKIEQVKEMVAQVKNLLGEAAKNCTFSTSGHSLGAILSDLTAVEIISNGLNFSKSTTFDNPGSQAIVEKAITDNLFTGKIEQSINDLAEHCEIYNAKPNFINGTNAQLGKTHLVLPDNTPVIETKAAVIESTGLWGWGAYLCSKVGSAVSVVTDSLGITSVTEQIKSHGLKNFATLEKSAAVFLTDNYQKIDGKLIIEYSSNLAKITSTGNDVVVLDQKDYSSMVHMTKDEYGFQDLSRTCAMEARSELTGESFNDDWDLVY
jgi:hypothetical protein